MQDKDVLRDFYLVFLGRRLLTSKSSSMTAEKMAITKMKDICGPHYSNKFETMITDFLTVSDSNTVRPAALLNFLSVPNVYGVCVCVPVFRNTRAGHPVL